MNGGSSECMKIRDHAEIINSVVLNGCESFLPMESINMKSLRTLRDNLVVSEKFGLAIEISLKSGLEKTGTMAAWGISCIKAGCFETGVYLLQFKISIEFAIFALQIELNFSFKYFKLVKSLFIAWCQRHAKRIVVKLCIF